MVLFCWRVKGSLLASSPFLESEGNHERMGEWAPKPQGEEERRVCNDLKFSFLLHPYMKCRKYHQLNQRWLMTFLDDPPQCLHSFRNTMLTEIGNIMIAPYHSLLLRSVNDFWGGLCDLSPAELINRQIRRLRKGCQENIMILNLTTFVVFPHN